MRNKYINKVLKKLNKLGGFRKDPIDDWLDNSPDQFFLTRGVRLALPDQTQFPKSIDRKLVKQLAREGDPYWQYLLSRMYDNGAGLKENPDNRMYWLEKAANRKNADALVTFAALNIGLNPFNHEILQMFEEAGQLGNEEAILNIALLNLKKRSIFGKEKQRSITQILDLCNNGHSRAKFNMAIAFLSGEDVERDLVQCMNLLEEADMQGVADGASIRALIYNSEIFSDYYDPCKAFYCMLRAVRRDVKYFPECLFDFFYDGRYMYKNLKDAKHIIDSPFLNNPNYSEIHDRQLKRWKDEFEKSRTLIATLVRKKNLEPEEHYTLAMEYRAVESGSRVEKTVLRHLQEAAEQGYTPAQLDLARFYNDEGDEKALYWGRMAVKESEAALFTCAEYLYDEGDERCILLLNEAVERGYSPANVALGTIHQYGLFGQKVDYEAAYAFYEKGIAKREDRAIDWYAKGHRFLAQLYTSGRGVAKDKEKAIALLKEGYAYDDLDCVFDLAKLFQNGDKYDDRMAFDIFLSLCRFEDYNVANACLATYYMRDSIHPMDPVAALGFLEEGYNQGKGYLVCLAGLVELAFSGLIPWLKPEYGLKLLKEGDLFSDWRVFYIKALMYDFGYLYKQDYAMARKYYEAAEECGCEKSKVNHALLLLCGLGGESDEQLATKLLQEAALAGVESAKYNLSVINGSEVKEKYKIELKYNYIDPETKSVWVLAKNCCQDILNFHDLAEGTFEPRSDCEIDPIPLGIEKIVKREERVVSTPKHDIKVVSIEGYDKELFPHEKLNKICSIVQPMTTGMDSFKVNQGGAFLENPDEPEENEGSRKSNSGHSKKSGQKRKKKR